MPITYVQSRALRTFTGVLLGIVAAFSFLRAQETPTPTEETSSGQGAPAAKEEAPAEAAQTAAPAGAIGPYKVSGGVSFGYRFVNLEGNRGKYNELLNLQQGFRVFDANFAFTPSETGKGAFDLISVSASGLGGDPFPSIRANIRKTGKVDLRLGYRAAQYVYDLPQTPLTPNRGWNDRRRFGDADLKYTPTRNLRFRFFYNRTERDGNDLAISPFFYVPLAPNVWEALGRFDSIPWIVPLREEANLYGGGIDYHIGKTDLHVEQSYRTYNNPANLRGLAAQSFFVLGPLSPAQNLVVQRWDTLSTFNIPTTSFRIDQEVMDWLQLRAGYIYTHASGPTSLDGSISQPGLFVLNFTGAGDVKMTTQTADAGFTLKLFEPVELMSDYRYQTYTENGRQSLQARRADLPAAVPIADDNLRWDFGIHTLDTVLAVVPVASLSVRGGVRFLKEDIVRKTNGEIDRGTQRFWSYTPLINAAWTPSGKFNLRGNFESRVMVDPYVRISPESAVGSTIRARLNLTDKWGIDNTFSFRNLKTEDLGFTSHVRSNSTMAFFQPLSKVGLQGGFTYGSFSSENTLRFLFGARPLNVLSTDQTIDRVYSAGIKITPTSPLTLGFTGQFIRSTGLGTLTGEPSAYGPLTWPAWSAEIGYLTKNVGRIVFGWQRSYYLENLFRAADYSANAFTLKFERNF